MLYVSPTSFPFTMLFRSFNYVYMERFPPYFNLFGALDLLLVAQITGVLLFANTRLCSTILRRICIEEDGRTIFLRPTIQLKDRKSTRLNSSHVSISYAVF